MSTLAKTGEESAWGEQGGNLPALSPVMVWLRGGRRGGARKRSHPTWFLRTVTGPGRHFIQTKMEL